MCEGNAEDLWLVPALADNAPRLSASVRRAGSSSDRRASPDRSRPFQEGRQGSDAHSPGKRSGLEAAMWECSSLVLGDDFELERGVSVECLLGQLAVTLSCFLDLVDPLILDDGDKR